MYVYVCHACMCMCVYTDMYGRMAGDEADGDHLGRLRRLLHVHQLGQRCLRYRQRQVDAHLALLTVFLCFL